MIEYPLTRTNRIRLARAFAQHPKVDISIDCVVEDQMGKAYVDNPENPSLFLIEQGNFFCYFAGDSHSAAGEAFVRNLPGSRLLMALSSEWFASIQQVHSDRLTQIERYLFSSENLSLTHLQQLLDTSPVRDAIYRITPEHMQAAVQAGLEISDFESPEDFFQRGIGFVFMADGVPGGVAYSSLVSSKSIEVSIFVNPEHRRKGVATALGSALLAWCLAHHTDPHWDAANEESCKLAIKLGYIPAGSYQAYFMK